VYPSFESGRTVKRHSIMPLSWPSTRAVSKLIKGRIYLQLCKIRSVVPGHGRARRRLRRRGGCPRARVDVNTCARSSGCGLHAMSTSMNANVGLSSLGQVGIDRGDLLAGTVRSRRLYAHPASRGLNEECARSTVTCESMNGFAAAPSNADVGRSWPARMSKHAPGPRRPYRFGGDRTGESSYVRDVVLHLDEGGSQPDMPPTTNPGTGRPASLLSLPTLHEGCRPTPGPRRCVLALRTAGIDDSRPGRRDAQPTAALSVDQARAAVRRMR